MARTSFDHMQCPVARALEVVGDGWTVLILRDVAIGVRRFEALQRDLQISRKVLAQRLATLVEQEVVERVAYQEHPPRHEYRLTERGWDLGGVLLALQAWGERWAFDATPIAMRHERCGARMHVVPCCSQCGEPVLPQDITPVAGPGLDAAPDGAEIRAALDRLATAAAQRSDSDQ